MALANHPCRSTTTCMATLAMMLVGLSRKSLIGTLTGRSGGERIHGSIALAVLAVAAGARIVRAHDVAATVDALKVTAAVIGGE